MQVVIARYPFQATPGMSQLSFPAGAEIQAQTGGPNQGGWRLGSYKGRQGWFPESYVVVVASPSSSSPPRRETANDLQSMSISNLKALCQKRGIDTSQMLEKREMIQALETKRSSAGQKQPKKTPQSYNPPQQPPQVVTPERRAVSPPPIRRVQSRSPNLSYPTTAPSLSVDTTTSSDYPNTNSTNDVDDDDEAFPMMGGVPGDLFEGAPRPVHYVVEEPAADSSFLKEQEPQEAPVDIYRHAPAPRRRNYAVDYTPEISVQITSKPTNQEEAESAYTPRFAKVAPSPDFWRAHPGRAPGPATAEQAFELERAFEDLKEQETIQIEATSKPKKKRFSFLPKSLKRAAKKTAHAVKKH